MRILAGTVFAVFLTAGPAVAEDWSEYDYPDQGVAIQFPAKPQAMKSTYDSVYVKGLPSFVVSAEDVVAIPDGVPAQRAVLTANLETALNILWDGGAAPGDRIVVIGGGIVGCLAATLAAHLPAAEVTLVDVDSTRAALAKRLDVAFADPKSAPRDADLVIHTSATAAGLSLAFECAGDEATVVEASWHGDDACEVPLGGAFHSRRLKLVSSQVGNIACERRPRWTRRRRLETAARLLLDERLDALVGEEIPFAELPRHLPRLFARGAAGVGALVRY